MLMFVILVRLHSSFGSLSLPVLLFVYVCDNHSFPQFWFQFVHRKRSCAGLMECVRCIDISAYLQTTFIPKGTLFMPPENNVGGKIYIAKRVQCRSASSSPSQGHLFATMEDTSLPSGNTPEYRSSHMPVYIFLFCILLYMKSDPGLTMDARQCQT